MSDILEDFSSLKDKRKMEHAGRILTIDIERLPGLARVFDQKTNFVSYRNFREMPRTICWAARWKGQKRMLFEAEWKDPEAMLRKSWELFDQADAVVTFNGKRFDVPHLKGAWIKAGYPAPRPWKDIDLFAMGRRKFGFISDSLDNVTKELGYTGKTDAYSITLAEAAVGGDKAAQKRLKEYNAGDIVLTEWLHDRLLGHLPTHPHLGRTSKITCNQCGGKELTEQPNNYKAVLLQYQMFRCDNCGGIVRSNWNVARTAISRGVS